MSVDYNPVGWFEIPVIDMPRARSFYEYILGAELELYQMGPLEMAWFPMREGAIGAGGSLVKGETYKPSLNGVLVYITAPDIDATLVRVKERGGRILQSKTSIGEYGFVGFFEDCEGNRIGLHSRE